MTARILPDERDQVVDVIFDTKQHLKWVVREDPKLQAELNKLTDTGGELSSTVVNKVLARIKKL
jgi:hypothetical protein